MKILTKLRTLIILIVINHIISCSSIYIPLLTPPKAVRFTGELINTNPNVTELVCEPLNEDQLPPTLVLNLNIRGKKLAACPSESLPFFDRNSLKNISVNSGDTIKVDLTYSGFPEPKIEYYKIDQKILETDRIKTFKQLVIMNATRDIDQGIYTVIATNAKGQDLVEFEIQVLDRPSPPVGPLNAVLNSPTTITLSWSPPIETNNENITQYIIERLVLNDEWINFLNTSKTNKTIGNLNVGEIYIFRVRAVNKYGISDPLVMKLGIKARGEPSMPKDLQVVGDRGSVQLVWTPPKRDNGEPVTAYVVEQREIPDGEWVNTVRNNGELYATDDKVKVGKVYDYRVSAVNDVGKSEPSKISQSVLIRPELSRARIDKLNLINTEISVGSPVTIEAQVSGEPDPEYQWKLNGKPVSDLVQGISISTEGKKIILRIESFAESYSGIYALSVNNSIGGEEASMTLTMPTPTNPIPSVIQMPTIDKSNFNDMNSFMGQPFTFEAMISDNPQINYECRKNGKLIDQSLDKITVNRVGKKFILYIKSVDESHAGLYSLISSNSNARDEASFNLTVLPVQNSSANLSTTSTLSIPQLPLFDKSNFKNKEAMILEPFIFVVPIDGSSGSDYQWRKNGRPIDENLDNIKVKKDEKKILLFIKLVDESHAGRYTLVMNNSRGRDEASFNLNVVYEQISNETPISLQISDNSAALPFQNLSASPSGISASNMSQKPSIDKSNFKDTEITIGNAFKFETIIKTNSDFEYQWKKNGIPIDRKSENIKLSKDGNRLILSIKSVDGNNEGEYSLVVGNSYGRDEASFILSIKYISFPGPPAGPLSFEIIDDGNKVVLKCSPPENNGEIPVVEYKFEKSDPLLGKWIVLNKTKVCQMTAVIDSNITNSYRVKAINYLGESEPLYGEIKINKKVCNLNPDSGDECLQSSANPRLPSAPNGTLGAYKTSAYSAFIKWAQPIDFGDSELEPYKIQLFDSKTNNWLTIDRTYNTEALVTGLKPSASYRFRVIAVNKDGDSDPLEGKYDNSYSKPVMIACPPPVLGSIGVNETTATSVKLNWDQPNYVNLNLYLPFIYKVEKFNSSTTNWDFVTNTTDTFVTIKELKCCSLNVFRVKTANILCDGVELVSRVIQTNGDRPESVSGPIQVSNIQSDQLTISWNPPENSCGSLVKEYIVEKKLDLKSNKWELLGRTKSTINRIRNLDPQQTYVFRVKAVNSFGESNPIVSDRFVTKSLESTTSNATPITTTTTTSTTTVKPIVMKTKDLTFSVTTPLKKSLSMNGVNQQVSREANQNTWNTIEMASKMVDDDTDDLKTLAMLDRLPKPRDNDY